MKYVSFFSVVAILTLVEIGGGGGVKEREWREGMCINGAFAIFYAVL